MGDEILITELIDIQWAEKIRKECMNDDPEKDHYNADQILLDFLSDLGFENVVEAFKEVPKYYA